MNIYFFLKDDSDSSFHKIEMEAWLEVERTNRHGEQELRFQLLDDVSLMISTDPAKYDSTTVKIESGKDSIMGHWAHNLKEFLENKLRPIGRAPFNKISQTEYWKERQKVADLIASNLQPPDFLQFQGPQNFSERVIIG